jgi:hypothetical protein
MSKRTRIITALSIMLVIGGCAAAEDEDETESTGAAQTAAPPQIQKYTSEVFHAAPWAGFMCRDDGYNGVDTCNKELDPVGERWMRRLENNRGLDCFGALTEQQDVKGTTCGYQCDYSFVAYCCKKPYIARWGLNDEKPRCDAP